MDDTVVPAKGHLIRKNRWTWPSTDSYE